MSIQTFNTPYEIKLNTINGEPISVAIKSERHIIYDSQIQLAQIPDEFYKVNITGKIERIITDTLNNSSDFKVDYRHGVVYFHPSLEGKSITINTYYGKGIKLLYDKRIKISDLKGNWNSTNLKDLLIEIKQYINNHIKNYNNHVAGTADKHKAPDIDYTGNVNNQTNVKGAIDNLQTQLNQVVNNGTESDARVSQALVDSEETIFTTLKERNDAWEARTKKIEGAVYKPENTPEIHYHDNIITTGQAGYDENGNLTGSYIDSVEDNGQVSVGVKGVTRTNIFRDDISLTRTTGAFVGVGSTLSLDATTKVFGTESLQVTAGVNANEGVRTEALHKVYNGKTYTGSAYVKVPNGQPMQIFIRRGANGTVLSPIVYFIGTGLWQRVFVTFVSNGDYTDIGLWIRKGSGSTSVIYNISGLMLEESVNLNNFITGTNSTVLAQRIKSTGKNLFDKDNGWEYGNISATSWKLGGTAPLTRTKIITCKPNTTYYASGSDRHIWRFTDKNGNFISGINSSSAISPTNAYQMQVYFSFTGEHIDSFQLEEGTTATPYEPYKEDKTYISCTDDDGDIEELQSLPNGVKDEVKSGKLYRRIEKIILDGSKNWVYATHTTDNIAFELSLLNDGSGVYPSCNLSPDIPHLIAWNAKSEHYYVSTTKMFLSISKSKLSTQDVAGLKTYLSENPMTLTYQLAEPKLIELPNIQPLHVYKNGTIQFDNIIKETSIYNDAEGCIVTHRDYPIKSVDFIKKVGKETGEETSLDVSKAQFVLENGKKIGFTHPDLVNNDLVKWDYYYENESTNPEKVISYPINTKALIGSNAKSSTKNSNSIETLNNQVSNLMTDLNSQKLPSIKGQASIIDMPIGARYGGFNELIGDGQTLVNGIINGNFSNGTIGWDTQLYRATVSVSNNTLSIIADGSSKIIISATTTSIEANNNDKIFFYTKAKINNSVSNYFDIYYNATSVPFTSFAVPIDTIHTPSQDKWYEMYKIKIIDTTNFTGKIRVCVRNTYPDTTTANGKVMEVDGNAGVFAINMTQLGIEDYTEEQMLDLVRNGYFEGMQSVVNPTFKTEGVNLFDKYELQNAHAKVTQIDGGVNLKGTYYAKYPFTHAKIGTSYTMIWNFKEISGNARNAWLIEYQDGSLSPYKVNGSTNTVVKNARNIFLYVASSTFVEANYTNIRLIEGTQPTPYKPYQHSQASIKMADGTDCIARSLPNGVRDEINILSQKMVRNVGERILKSVDIEGVLKTTANVDLVYTVISARLGAVSWHNNKNNTLVEGYSRIPYEEEDNVSSIGSYTQSGDRIRFPVAKGTYANTAEAQNAFAGTKIQYQLLNPKTEDIQVNGSLISFTGGRLLQWNGYNQAHTADSSGKITLNYPVGEIDEIFFFDGEGDKVIETSYALSADGFSITELTPNKSYHVEGKAKNQIMAEISGKTVGNKGEQIDSNTETNKIQGKQISDIQNQIDLLRIEVI